MFQKLDLFSFSGEGRKTPALLGSLERADLNHWVGPVILRDKNYNLRGSDSVIV
jgi:hypothetical protein